MHSTRQCDKILLSLLCTTLKGGTYVDVHGFIFGMIHDISLNYNFCFLFSRSGLKFPFFKAIAFLFIIP